MGYLACGRFLPKVRAGTGTHPPQN